MLKIDYVMRILRFGLLCFGLLCLVGPRIGAQAPLRFAEVRFRLFTSGINQPTQEVGTFQASLPLGKTGHLKRKVEISNETRGIQRELVVSLDLTPTLGADDSIHCLVLSDARPDSGKTVSRVRDIRFDHPGEKVMEIFADSETGTHLNLAIHTKLVGAPTVQAGGEESLPAVRFTLRVEQWVGAQRAEMESCELISIDGQMVSHDYEKRIPRWVEGGPEDPDDPLKDLPVLDLNEERPMVEAGQGFSIMLTPDEKAKGKKKSKDPEQPEPEPPPPKHMVWGKEFYRVTIRPVFMEKNRLEVRLEGEGQVLDPVTGEAIPLPIQSVVKSLGPFEPLPLYITREVQSGTTGFVFWLIPDWRNNP